MGITAQPKVEFAFYQILSLASRKKDIPLPIKKVIPVLQYSISLAYTLYYKMVGLSMVFSKNNHFQLNRTSVCHSERRKAHAPPVVELPRVERQRTSGSKVRSTAGIWFEISVTCQWNVTFTVVSHPKFEPYPIVAFAPRFCLFANAQPAKLRLRKPLRDFLRSE